MRVVDLSAPIAPSPPETPPWQRTDIQYLNHAGGAAEVDVVMNISAFLSGETAYVAEELRLLTQEAKDAGSEATIIKVIVETAYLPDAEAKTLAVRLVAGSGADFIKTSTGFAPSGATVEDVSLLSREAPEGLSVKASGGIRTLDDALAMIDAGAARLGTSGSVDIVREAQAHSLTGQGGR